MGQSETAVSQTPVEFVRTSDGARIAISRRPADGPPVIFLHGIAVHGGIWNLPDVKGEDFEYRSLSTLLHEAGYDIWLVSFRGQGAGDAVSEPPPDQKDWSVDHFILYDLPAVVDHVAASTKEKPFIIASSMGALALGGYLQGAVLTSDESPHIVADPEVARRRQAGLAGCVLAEYPAVLRWPKSLYDANDGLNWRALLKDMFKNEPGYNYPFEALSRWTWLEAILTGAGEVPLDWLGSGRSGLRKLKLPKFVTEALDKAERAAMEAFLKVAGKMNGSSNQRAEVIIEGRRRALDRIKSGVLSQLGKSVRARSFVSALGSPDHDYAAHYSLIDLPLVVVIGGRDRIANAEMTREGFFDVVKSQDKSFWLFEKIGHGELTAAPLSYETIYPRIVEWIDRRAGR